MSKQNNGGPAFPTPEVVMPGQGADGMSLHDYFRGQALIGLVIANETITNGAQPLGWKVESVASAASRYADAMLAEREANHADE